MEETHWFISVWRNGSIRAKDCLSQRQFVLQQRVRWVSKTREQSQIPFGGLIAGESDCSQILLQFDSFASVEITVCENDII